MNFISSLEQAEKLLAKNICDLTGLPDTSVLNGLSLYGAELDHYIMTYAQSTPSQLVSAEVNPIAPTEGFIVFETINDPDSPNNIVEPDKELTVPATGDPYYEYYVYNAYKLKVCIYGNLSDSISKSLKSKMLQIDNKAILALQGLQITKISNISSLNEFKNASLWQRRDFEISFVLRQKL